MVLKKQKKKKNGIVDHNIRLNLNHEYQSVIIIRKKNMVGLAHVEFISVTLLLYENWFSELDVNVLMQRVNILAIMYILVI